MTERQRRLELEAEAHIYGTSESFVTASYKKKMEELRRTQAGSAQRCVPQAAQSHGAQALGRWTEHHAAVREMRAFLVVPFDVPPLVRVLFFSPVDARRALAPLARFCSAGKASWKAAPRVAAAPRLTFSGALCRTTPPRGM